MTGDVTLVTSPSGWLSIFSYISPELSGLVRGCDAFRIRRFGVVGVGGCGNGPVGGGPGLGGGRVAVRGERS